MKNICIVSECQQILGVGGTETVSYLLKEGLKKNGFSVWSIFLIPKARIDDGDILLPDGQDICSDKNKSYLTKIISANRIDIILLQGTPVDDLLNLCTSVKKATQIKLAYTYHFNPLMIVKDFDDYKERLLYKKKDPLVKQIYRLYFVLRKIFFNREALKKVKSKFLSYDIDNIDAFISLSEEYSNFFKGVFNKKYHEKFHCIANPIQIDDSADRVPKENNVLFVGRLSAQKRLDRLLFIWRELYQTFSNWKLVIVGNGEYSDTYKELAKELHLKNIEFIGQHPSEDYFKKSKIVCMTSSHEALPMVLIEAQKYGCVPIAYNSFEAATDIIENGYNGLLIKPFKQKEYAKALSTLMSEESYRESLAANGSAFIEKFNIEIVIKDWIKLLTSL